MDGPISSKALSLVDTVETLFLETIELTDEEFEDLLQAILAECEKHKDSDKTMETCRGFIDAIRSSRAGYMAILRGEA